MYLYGYSPCKVGDVGDYLCPIRVYAFCLDKYLHLQRLPLKALPPHCTIQEQRMVGVPACRQVLLIWDHLQLKGVVLSAASRPHVHRTNT